MTAAKENWGSGDAYEYWIGRWSRPAARLFLDGLEVPAGRRWADVGCGTGALTQTIVAQCAPARVQGADKSPAYVKHAASQVADARASFEEADAQALAWPDAAFDAVVSGLVLNFVPSPERMAAEMKRVARSGGAVAAYVWDYSGGMQMVRRFWDAAVALHPGDASVDQAERFPICKPDALADLWHRTGLACVRTRSLDFTMTFRNFDDYWQPFLGRQGAAPTYLAALSTQDQERIRETLRSTLPVRADGSIELGARAWAVQGVVP
jgi:trans-aconitate methyltransferase